MSFLSRRQNLYPAGPNSTKKMIPPSKVEVPMDVWDTLYAALFRETLPTFPAIRILRRFTFSDRHTKSHSPCAFSSPRRLKLRKPHYLFDPTVRRFRQPLARHVYFLTLRGRQLIDHALHRRMFLGINRR